MILVLLFQSISACEYLKEFSECSQGQLAALITPNNCTDNTEFVVSGLSCTFPCAAGTYLDYDIALQALTCKECEAGTFSIGGGVLISSWNSLKEFNTESYCWVMQSKGWDLNKGCTSWHSSSDSIIVSGTAGYEKWYETDLIFYPQLVKNGSFSITYRKETSNIGGWSVGDLYIFIDDALIYYDYESDTPHWITKKFALAEGLHTIEIVFDKYVTTQVSEVQIREIQVRGTSFSEKFCENCYEGYSSKGSDSCKTCEIGNYLDGKDCVKCPAGYISKPGSISVDDCFEAEVCTSTGYYYYYSPCEDGKMKKVYEWNSPLLCNNIGLDLPVSENIPCKSCSYGKYYKDQVCEPCPTGYFITDSSYGNTCEACPVGKYAPKISEYSDWTEIPQNFVVSCISFSKAFCSFSWEPRGTYLSTSPIYDDYSQIILQTTVKIVETDAVIEFSSKVQGTSTRLSLYIDGVVQSVTILQVSDDKTYFYSTRFNSTGEHTVKWICQHADGTNEICEILEIVIKGTEDGGATICKACEIGYYSKGLSDFCIACPNGSTSNPDSSDCGICLENSYSDMPGPCKECTAGSISSSNHTECTLNSTLHIENSTFLIGNLTGLQGGIPEYCKLERFKMYCHQTFYGPSEGNNNYFYISAMNPSYISMPSYVQATNMNSYAFGIIEKEQLSVYEQQMLKPNDTCESDYSRIIVNLGSELSNLTKTETGFNVSYNNGDLCTPDEKFSMKIQFVCDKFEKEGWPTYMGLNKCNFEFLWPTIHACEICAEEMLIENVGLCHHNKKTIHYFEGPFCIMGTGKVFKTKEIACNHNHVFKTMPFIVSMILVIIMIIIVGLTIFCACRSRNRYNRLIQYKADGRNIELSAQ